jgi:osmotically-inducible protein OsmY
VLARLICDPQVHTGHVDVAVADGVVTLSGYVTSIAQKDAARNAAARISGVARVANTLVVAVPCLPFAEFPIPLTPARHARAA